MNSTPIYLRYTFEFRFFLGLTKIEKFCNFLFILYFRTRLYGVMSKVDRRLDSLEENLQVVYTLLIMN